MEKKKKKILRERFIKLISDLNDGADFESRKGKDMRIDSRGK